MAKAPNSERLFIDGPVGRLESVLEWPSEGEISGIVTVCHPHPQHGGTMHNKVAHTLARAFTQMNFATLRFNFRGPEQSAGQFDEGVGELDDALAAIDWLEARLPGYPLWLAGFSFGAAIAVRAAVKRGVDGLVSVAPAVARFASGLDAQPECPWLVVQGDEDELVSVEETIDWLNSLEPGPALQILNGAEHFFHGRLVDLRKAVVSFVEQAHGDQA